MWLAILVGLALLVVALLTQPFVTIETGESRMRSLFIDPVDPPGWEAVLESMEVEVLDTSYSSPSGFDGTAVVTRRDAVSIVPSGCSGADTPCVLDLFSREPVISNARLRDGDERFIEFEVSECEGLSRWAGGDPGQVLGLSDAETTTDTWLVVLDCPRRPEG